MNFDPMDESARSIGWNNNAERMQAMRRDDQRKAYLNSPENGERLRKIEEEIKGHRKNVGVKSHEYTADELRAGRIALGMEAADAAE